MTESRTPKMSTDFEREHALGEAWRKAEDLIVKLQADLAAAKAQIAAAETSCVQWRDNLATANAQIVALEAKRNKDIRKCEQIIIDGISGKDALEAFRAAFPEVFKFELRELAKAAYDSRILGHSAQEIALNRAIGEKT